MKVLIACEYSGLVRDEFRRQGHEAWSCDILPTETPGPHIQDNVLNHLGPCQSNNYKSWDLLIGFPPCDHLAVSGAAWFEKKRNDGRQREAIEFFMKLYNSPIEKKALENPVNILGGEYVQNWFPDLCEIYGLPMKPSQIIEPYYFGDNANKKTCLWLQGLKPLLHNDMPNLFDDKVTHVKGSEYITSSSGKRYPDWCWNTGGGSGKKRSKTFPGIAKAMADQWGNIK